MKNRPSVVSIAGSDSGGGAGIQADLKAITALGVHGATILTAITAQNSRAVTDVYLLPDSIIESQFDAVMSDLRPAVVKLGMLGDSRIVRAVARKLQQWKPEHVVLDPVMIASSGARLLAEDAVEALRSELVPLATIVTPNWPEAVELAGEEPRSGDPMDAMAEALRRIGVRRALIKGGHRPGPEVVDLLVEPSGRERFLHPRIPNAEGHGTGCALASALAAGLALGKSYREAARNAIDFVWNSLERRYAVGDSKPLYLHLSGAEP